MTLLEWVEQAGGSRPRVMRTHYGSAGAPDLVFEQEVSDPSALDTQIKKVTRTGDFQRWAKQVSELLEQPANRELYSVCAGSKMAPSGILI
jgi:hypothetical protein